MSDHLYSQDAIKKAIDQVSKIPPRKAIRMTESYYQTLLSTGQILISEGSHDTFNGVRFTVVPDGSIPSGLPYEIYEESSLNG
ncbi:hypothetical protein HSE3_gp141 [Bacillus phage vB_BceM-HSE3]|nr:hypothetical protein HSE3_gp141 [Bacillus phage vB_BceM-HSE3]